MKLVGGQSLLVAMMCAALSLASAPATALADAVDQSSLNETQVTLVDEYGANDGEVALEAMDESVEPTTSGDVLFETVVPVVTTYSNMYRLCNPNSGEHFYTSSWTEATTIALAGWRMEGVGWVAPSVGDPVYRLYNPNGGDHHYTLSAGERDLLVDAGWLYEGVGFYSDNTAGGTGVYRQYNPNASTGAHNFTMSKGENDNLVAAGWDAEGIAWNASSVGATNVSEGWISNAAGDRIYVNANATVNIGLFYIGDNLYCGDKAGKVLRNQTFTRDGVRYAADNEGVLSLAPIPEGLEDIFAHLSGMSSATDYGVIVDTNENKVAVFEGGTGSWSLIRSFLCTSGAPYTPTVKGTFTLTDRGYAFGTSTYTCYYFTRIYGDYLFHSVLYDAGTFNVQDGRLGENLSHGCVRLDINDAKWINENLPYGTTVIIF